MTVTSGTADVTASRRAFKSISGYNDSASDYDITDNAANLISAGDHVLNVTGVDVVTVNDGATVNCSDGAFLAGFTADVDLMLWIMWVL